MQTANEPIANLTIGYHDLNKYGFATDAIYGGNAHPHRVRAVYQGNGQTLLLEASGFDIDVPGEGEVYLNGNFLGHLNQTGNGGTGPATTFTLPLSLQNSGQNEIEFVRAEGASWGVTAIGLFWKDGPDISLTPGQMDTGQYGHLYGSRQHYTRLDATFDGPLVDAKISVTGWDIDFSTEVSVSLNGTAIGYLPAGSNGQLSPRKTFTLANSLITSGTNTITFQTTPRQHWGVTNMLLEGTNPTAALPAIMLLLMEDEE